MNKNIILIALFIFSLVLPYFLFDSEQFEFVGTDANAGGPVVNDQIGKLDVFSEGNWNNNNYSGVIYNNSVSNNTVNAVQQNNYSHLQSVDNNFYSKYINGTKMNVFNTNEVSIIALANRNSGSISQSKFFIEILKRTSRRSDSYTPVGSTPSSGIAMLKSASKGILSGSGMSVEALPPPPPERVPLDDEVLFFLIAGLGAAVIFIKTRNKKGLATS